ncbi:diphthamide synthesis protein [Candidatus Woesearchaeota archaeon]|nr:diphthamide synthesis protein [Candidatus Woesearchaeota archaeon]
MNLGLNIGKVIEHINSRKVNSVLIQLPDGLKPKAKEIVDRLESETKAKIYTYLGTCYGACDIPTDVQVDLIVQWGHSSWIYQ